MQQLVSLGKCGVLAGVLVGALAVSACGGGGGGAAASPTAPSAAAPPPAAPAASTVTVAILSSIGNSAFSPNPVRANTGDSVVFRNSDAVMHRLVLDDGSMDFGDIAPGSSSRAFQLRSTSAVNFHCTLHASMVGSINGATAPEPPACVDIYGYGC